MNFKFLTIGIYQMSIRKLKKSCAWCGKPFSTERGDKIFCSADSPCAKAYHRFRRRFKGLVSFGKMDIHSCRECKGVFITDSEHEFYADTCPYCGSARVIAIYNHRKI